MVQVFEIVEGNPNDPLAALRQSPAETIYDRLMAEHERATAQQPFNAAAHDRAHYDAQDIASGTLVFNSLEEALDFLTGR